jgi:hypothetical protein
MSTTIRGFVFVPGFFLALLLVFATVVMGEEAQKQAFIAIGTGCDPGNLNPGTAFFNKKGTIMHIRGMEHCSDVDASVFNANLQLSYDEFPVVTGSGSAWGTFRIEVDDEIVWEGSYSGYVYELKFLGPDVIAANTMTTVVGHGAGDCNGLKIEMTTVQDAPTEYMEYGLGVVINTNKE